MINIAYYTGIIIAAIQVESKQIPCPLVNTSDGKLYANCFGIPFKRIPQNLGQNLQILNISYTPILHLSSEDLKPYPELIELNMNSLSKVRLGEFHHLLLAPLKKLKVLRMCKTLVQLPPLYLPPSITELIANGLPRTYAFINFSTMTNLVHLELRHCNMHGLPNLSTEAPLDSLHIQNNYLNKLRYTDLAPYCLLREVKLTKSELSTDRLFGHCCDILIWLEDHNVTNTLECKRNSILTPCDRGKYTPHPNAILAYDRCLIRNGLLSEPSNRMYIIVIVTVVIMVIIVVGLGGVRFYFYHKSKKSQRQLKKN